jgi:hypothetical protein
MSLPPVFSGVRVTRSSILYLCFVDHCLSFVLFILAIVLSVFLLYTILITPLISSNSSSHRLLQGLTIWVTPCGCLIRNKNCLPFTNTWALWWGSCWSSFLFSDFCSLICLSSFCVLCTMLLVSFDCTFLNAPSVFFKVYMCGLVFY